MMAPRPNFTSIAPTSLPFSSNYALKPEARSVHSPHSEPRQHVDIRGSKGARALRANVSKAPRSVGWEDHATSRRGSRRRCGSSVRPLFSFSTQHRRQNRTRPRRGRVMPTVSARIACCGGGNADCDFQPRRRQKRTEREAIRLQVLHHQRGPVAASKTPLRRNCSVDQGGASPPRY
jgi:hypothetical protein